MPTARSSCFSALHAAPLVRSSILARTSRVDRDSTYSAFSSQSMWYVRVLLPVSTLAIVSVLSVKMQTPSKRGYTYEERNPIGSSPAGKAGQPVLSPSKVGVIKGDKACICALCVCGLHRCPVPPKPSGKFEGMYCQRSWCHETRSLAR